jgi:hypothetical protein
VFFSMLTCNYYAIGRAARHEARVHPKGADVSARHKPIDATKKTSYKGAGLTVCSVQYTRYETLGGVFDRRRRIP